MRFTHSYWLLVGAGVCAVLVWLWFRVDARQHAALARFVSAHLRNELTHSISKGRRRLQRGLLLAALALLFVALAGPQIGFRWEEISRRGNEIVFLVDTSRSMLTPDIKPDRLTRAKLAIDDFTNRLDGDAVGIVAFAGSAFLACPLTLDYNAFRETLNSIDTDIIPRGGTNISSAIREAQAALRRRPGSDRIAILITDGEDLEGSALSAAKSAQQDDKLRIYTVGVGTPAGDLIPVPPVQGGGFVKDPNGQYVRSHLDDAALKAVAEATGGFYVPLGAQGEGLQSIYDNVLGRLAKHDLASRRQKIYIERYQWPLAAALAALLLSLMIGNRKRRSRKVAPLKTPTTAATALSAASWLAIALALSLHTSQPADAAAPASDPNAPALPSEPIQAYNAGTAAYRAGQFPRAAEAFQQSISHAPSNDPRRLAEQEDAYYNLGNTLYRAGQQAESSAPQDAIKTWTDAVKAYETALQLRADDADSKYNRDLVKRKIAKLQQQQQNQDQNKDKNNKDKNQGQGQGQGQGKGQGGGQDHDQQQEPKQTPPSQQQQPNPSSPPDKQPQQNQSSPSGQQPPSGQPPPQTPPSSPSPGSPAQSKPPDQRSPADQRQAQQPPPGQAPAPGDAAQSPPPSAADEDSRTADNQHLPGQMSREEARELLDSVKGEEKRMPPIPAGQNATDIPQTPPTKNW